MSMARRVTCLVSEDEHLFLADSGLILQNLSLQDPILNYVMSVCSAFHTQHGFGLKSLLYLTTEIYKLSSSLHKQGIPISHIQKHLEASFEICKSAAKEIEIPIHKSKEGIKTENCLATKESAGGNYSRNDTAELDENLFNISPDVMVLQKRTTAEESKIPVIQLKMSNLKNDEEEDLDDVDWFFTEDQPQGIGDIDPPVKPSNILSGAERYFDIEVNDVIHLSDQITSLKSGEVNDSDDDEFDDCFDDVPRVSKSMTFQSKNCINEIHQPQKTDYSQTVPSLVSPSLTFDKTTGTTYEKGLSDSEFNECFDEGEFDSQQDRNIQLDLQNIFKLSEKNGEPLDKLLRKMSNIRSCHNKVKNSSRHFKTIESTVKELRGDDEQSDKKNNGSEKNIVPETAVDSTDPLRVRLHNVSSAEKAQRLLEKLKVKPNSSKVLNSSRHYKTFSTTIEELNVSKNTHSEKTNPALAENLPSEDCRESEGDQSKFVRGKDLQSENEHLDFYDVGHQYMVNSNVLNVGHQSTENSDVCEGDGYQSIARGLSHGCEEVMDVVLMAARKQSHNQETLELNESRLHIITSCSRILCDNPGLVDGTIVWVSDDIIIAAVNKGEQLLRTVVINGEITCSFRHKGFQPTLDKVSTTLSLEEYQTNSEESWVGEVTQVLEQNKIDLVLTSGKISPDLQGQLPHIIFVPNIPFSALQSICSSSDVTMATYITDISQFHVCPEVSLKPLLEEWNCIDRNYINITLPNILTQTVVYSHPAQIGTDCFEQEFWRCVSSLSRALGKGTVLPGGGETERHCALALLNTADTVEHGTSSEIMKELAKVLHNYLHYVNGWSSISELVGGLSLALCQRGTSPVHPYTSTPLSPPDAHSQKQEVMIYDEETTKYDSWFAALNLALTLVQIDTSIVTGTDKSLAEL